MKLLKIILLSLAACSRSPNQSVHNIDSIENFVKHTYRVNHYVGYFFKPHPSGKYIAFGEIRGDGSSQNKLLSLLNGDIKAIPGKIDPVWEPLGNFYLYPESHGNNHRLYAAFVDLEEKKSPITTSYIGSIGSYQSIGLFSGIYRFITDYEGLSYGEFVVRDKKIYSKKKPQKICTNIHDFKTDLPMISKDGSYLSIYNEKLKSTEIYEISNPENCRLILSLGIKTGKVSFNFNSTQIAFHMVEHGAIEQPYFNGVDVSQTKNIYVLEMKKASDVGKQHVSRISKITDHQENGNGAYFPDFDQNGNIYFLENIGSNYQFSMVKKAAIYFVAYKGSNQLSDRFFPKYKQKHPIIQEKIFGQWVDREKKIDNYLQKNCMSCHQAAINYQKKYKLRTYTSYLAFEEKSILEKTFITSFDHLKNKPLLQKKLYDLLGRKIHKGLKLDNEALMIQEYIHGLVLKQESRISNAPLTEIIIEKKFTPALVLNEYRRLRKEIPEAQMSNQELGLYTQCNFAKKKCDQYITFKEMESKNIDGSAKTILKIKCMNHFQITQNECNEWENEVQP